MSRLVAPAITDGDWKQRGNSVVSEDRRVVHCFRGCDVSYADAENNTQFIAAAKRTAEAAAALLNRIEDDEHLAGYHDAMNELRSALIAAGYRENSQ